MQNRFIKVFKKVEKKKNYCRHIIRHWHAVALNGNTEFTKRFLNLHEFVKTNVFSQINRLVAIPDKDVIFDHKMALLFVKHLPLDKIALDSISVSGQYHVVFSVYN